jgi:hypothetical protein
MYIKMLIFISYVSCEKGKANVLLTSVYKRCYWSNVTLFSRLPTPLRACLARPFTKAITPASEFRQRWRDPLKLTRLNHIYIEQ